MGPPPPPSPPPPPPSQPHPLSAAYENKTDFLKVFCKPSAPDFRVKKINKAEIEKKHTHQGSGEGNGGVSLYWVANALLVTSSLTNFRKLFWMLITPFAHSVRIRKIRFRKQTWILLVRPRDCLLWRLLDYFTLRWCKIHLKIEILRRWL